MESIRTELDSEKVVAVAPVMAGKFALPWLMNVPNSFAGFVAIDTIETERYPDEQYTSMPADVSLLQSVRQCRFVGSMLSVLLTHF